MDKLKNRKTLEEFFPSAVQHEDAALKTTMHFFADVLLPYFHIEGTVVGFAPTELVHLDLKKLFQDFNLVMEDGSWKHFEFQSTNGGVIDLKRFRVYEATASYQYNVAVETYVLYSGNIKHPVTEFTEGGNTYRVHPIIMQNHDAHKVIQRLQYRLKHHEPITRQDLVPLALCPIMGGSMPQKERIQAAFTITREITSIDPKEVEKIEAVIYTMAEKFLDKISIEDVREEISMTRIGRMLVNEGIERGIQQGEKIGKEKTKLENARNLIGLLDEHVIAERIGLSLEIVEKLKEEKALKK